MSCRRSAPAPIERWVGGVLDVGRIGQGFQGNSPRRRRAGTGPSLGAPQAGRPDRRGGHRLQALHTLPCRFVQTDVLDSSKPQPPHSHAAQHPKPVQRERGDCARLQGRGSNSQRPAASLLRPRPQPSHRLDQGPHAPAALGVGRPGHRLNDVALPVRPALRAVVGERRERPLALVPWHESPPDLHAMPP